MWKNGSDLNDRGETVRLYVPIKYKYTGKRHPSVSWLGGRPSVYEEEPPVIPQCTICGSLMPLLVQLHVPRGRDFQVHRTLHIFLCSRGSCGRQVFASNKFSYGGAGIVECRRTQDMFVQEKQVPGPVSAPKPSPWGDEHKSDDVAEENDWGVDEDSDDKVDMESMLKDLEVSGAKTVGERTKRTSVKSTASIDPDTPCFTCYEIRAQQEPAGHRATGKNEDDDDIVGMASGSDKHIQEMLARYMAEEDDEEILSALRGAGVGGGIAEEDERLSDEDRAMLFFTDRVKRLPRHVLRYARDGSPLWSVPAPSKEVPVPDCPCGSKRIFECQLMPSILHVLEVDKYVAKDSLSSGSENQDKTFDLNEEFIGGGQNWGALAVYTCSASCESNQEEYVVLQDSVDEMPAPRGGDVDMVVAVQMDDDDEEEV